MSILWTIVPIQDIYRDNTGIAPLEEIAIGNARMLVQPENGGWARIERLISGNPQDYLRPDWQPGSYIPWTGTPGAAFGERHGQAAP